ncbi:MULTISPECIES: helix-turn-helix transcriptional regulator [unclassified Psychrobacter]|uniref:helix-turn-helix transcriptional regulator n=1 Tax=unclassified Psychrobacter TaxID=196806 RepID=UPI00191AFF16|nr:MULTISPECIES: AlpA family phage regulatory protein [unclassified Psychrobacter]|tara:strand:+ start:12414 stop:12710 length:297 start_codon:yes stop_codon:yes gene_type:complete
MTQHTTTDNPVIAFTDDTSNSIEQIAESLHVKYLPPQGMSRASQLIPFLPFGSSTLWAWSRDGRFPAPIKLSPTMTAWRNADVIEWLESHTSTTSEGV